MGSAVAIGKGVLAEILARAAGSPHEVCGLLLGTAACVEQLLHCRNVAADPARAFEIDPAQLIAAHRAARAGGPAIVGCYHSHPRGRPEPSIRDAREAASNGWLWLIVAAGEARLYRAVAQGMSHGRFDEMRLVDPSLRA